MRNRKSTTIAMTLAVAFSGIARLSVASAETPTAARIVPANPDRNCVGDTETLVWSPPSGTSRPLGYRVVRTTVTSYQPIFFTDDVGADQTSLSFTAVFGSTTAQIHAITSEGVSPMPFSTAWMFAGRAPQPMRWTLAGSGVGDATATAAFQWPGPVQQFTTGGLADSVRVTRQPGGASIDRVPSDVKVVATFDGLSNGVSYTFSAVTSNVCGASESDSSPPYVAGVAPTWVRHTPPPDVSSGSYVYKFAAVGDPAPTYRLLGAPSWLSISPVGLVSGTPPSGLTSFSYSAVAANDVGIGYFQNNDAVAGPFTVSVRSQR